jgi:cysteine-rich repeat protein
MGNRWLVGAVSLLFVGVVAGCVKPAEQTKCGDFTCGTASVCAPDGSRCVAPEVVEACRDKAEADACSFPGVDNGVCANQLCVAAGCGDSIVQTQSAEVCDDGNRISGDGCSADCRSTEICGDGILDPFNPTVREQCDCGLDPATLPVGCARINSDEPNGTCRVNCKPVRCGDKIIDEPTEHCDDGNTIAGDGCAADCTGRWTRMQSNTLAQLADVWAASPTDAWAVGGDRLLRWNGTVWSIQPGPTITNPSVTTPNYTSIWGASAQDVFVVASDRIFRYQGAGMTGSWSEVSPATRATSRWNRVHGSGAVIWAAGQVPTSSPSGRVARWDGSTFLDSGNQAELQGAILDVHVTSDGYAFATEDMSNYLYKLPPGGTVWTRVDSSTPGDVSAGHVSGATSTDMTFTAADSGPASHFDGSTTSLLAGSAELSFTYGTHAIPGSSLIVGRSGGILVCNAATCTPSQTSTFSDLYAVWMLGPKQAFVVGAEGTILY